MQDNINPPPNSAQHGAALITSLVILLVLTVVGISAMRGSSLQQNIVGNLRSHDLAIQAAASTLKEAENNLYLAGAAYQLPLPQPGNPTVQVNNNGTPVTYGPIFARGDSSLPTQLQQSAHDTTGDWIPANATTYTLASTNLQQNPEYIIQYSGMSPSSLDPEARAQQHGIFYYRITARGVGSTSNSVVLLQASYAIRH